MESVTNEIALVKERATVLENCAQRVARSTVNEDQQTILTTLKGLMYKYPELSSVGNLQRIDRFTVMAMGKIHLGLIGDLPKKIAIDEAIRYIYEAIKLIYNK